MTNILFIAAAYLLGSIPFGLITAKAVKGIDIREHGSRNIGATNVGRVVGKKWGILVFILDALKGYIAVSLPSYLTARLQPISLDFSLVLAVACILGHTFPLWLAFKGGKGVATSLGVFMAAAPLAAGICFTGWLVVFFLTHIISVASLAAAITFPMLCWLFYHDNPGFAYLFVVSMVLAVFIFYTHRANIQRLLKGEEKKIF